MNNIATRQDSMPTIADDKNSAMQILQTALANQMAPEVIKELLVMRKELQDEFARKAFYEDFKKFQLEIYANPPRKNRERMGRVQDDRGNWGWGIMYRYADLPEIMRVCGPVEVRYNFSHHWEQYEEDGMMITKCHFVHHDGHGIESKFACKIERVKNKQGDYAQTDGQASGVSSTYGQRYTYCAVTGVVAQDDTDDTMDGSTIRQQPVKHEFKEITSYIDLNEFEIAWKAIESAQDTRGAWNRVKAEFQERGDKGAIERMKERVIALVAERKAMEARNAERAQQPKTEAAPGVYIPTEQSEPPLPDASEQDGGALLPDAPLIGDKEKQKILDILFSWSWTWEEFTNTTAGRFGLDIDKMNEIDYKETMKWLKDQRPTIEGIARVSINDLRKLHAKLNKAGLPAEDFKEYHGLESAKMIELADFEKMLDFEASGFIDYLREKTAK